MKATSREAAFGLWAILWRSIVYVPMMLGVFVLLLVAFTLLVFPPIIGLLCLWFGVWDWAFLAFAIWGPVLWTWQRVGGNRWLRGH